MLYRIFTEDKNRDEIERIVSRYFQGFTIISAVGYWNGTKENSLIIEILGIYDYDKIVKICNEVKITNNQEAVLVELVKCESDLI